MTRRVIGILGGSFNPVHNGHLMLASYIAQFGPVDEVWLNLSPQNPFKEQSELLDDRHRLAMLDKAVNGSVTVKVCDVELSLPQPSYTINTMEKLESMYPDYDFRIIIGSDNWPRFPEWRDSEALIERYGLIVYPRRDYPLPDIVPDNVTVVDAPMVDISSTFIRECIAEGRDMNFFMPPQVYEYIERNKLYKMMESSTVLNNNSLAFIGLCNEYCQTLESARETECDDFIAAMLRLLPRIYITASDLKIDDLGLEEPYIDGRLDEDYYDSIRRSIENLLGPDDTYLEVFEEDMKYSDTPIAASVSEGLADIFQVLYNFLEAIKDVPNELIDQALIAVKDDFQSYWSRILCNVMRALNHIRYNALNERD